VDDYRFAPGFNGRDGVELIGPACHAAEDPGLRTVVKQKGAADFLDDREELARPHREPVCIRGAWRPELEVVLGPVVGCAPAVDTFVRHPFDLREVVGGGHGSNFGRERQRQLGPGAQCIEEF
jgi:hypothetical protein